MSPGLLKPKLQQSIVEGGCGKVTAYQHIQFLIVFVVIGERGNLWHVVSARCFPRHVGTQAASLHWVRMLDAAGGLNTRPDKSGTGVIGETNRGWRGRITVGTGNYTPSHALQTSWESLHCAQSSFRSSHYLYQARENLENPYRHPTYFLKTCGNMVYYDAFRKAADATHYSQRRGKQHGNSAVYCDFGY